MALFARRRAQFRPQIMMSEGDYSEDLAEAAAAAAEAREAQAQALVAGMAGLDLSVWRTVRRRSTGTRNQRRARMFWGKRHWESLRGHAVPSVIGI